MSTRARSRHHRNNVDDGKGRRSRATDQYIASRRCSHRAIASEAGEDASSLARASQFLCRSITRSSRRAASGPAAARPPEGNNASPGAASVRTFYGILFGHDDAPGHRVAARRPCVMIGRRVRPAWHPAHARREEEPLRMANAGEASTVAPCSDAAVLTSSLSAAVPGARAACAGLSAAAAWRRSAPCGRPGPPAPE